jgi:hypothetical protein
MSFITLITDFGLKDGNVGVMKGVIWGIAPQVQIADLSHTINPQNIPEAALILLRSTPYFPGGTIHVVVVDPGVGTSRRPVAARIGNHYFVGPDNGVITMWLNRAERDLLAVKFVHLDNSKYWLPEVSYVFHGRDIFAPVAGHLAIGVSLMDLGPMIDDPIRLDLPQPIHTSLGLQGQIIHLDHFGNISTNIRREHLQPSPDIVVTLRGVSIKGILSTFGELPPGDLIALFGSTGNLIVSVVNGDAAQRLGAQVGDPVEVIL